LDLSPQRTGTRRAKAELRPAVRKTAPRAGGHGIDAAKPLGMPPERSAAPIEAFTKRKHGKEPRFRRCRFQKPCGADRRRQHEPALVRYRLVDYSAPAMHAHKKVTVALSQAWGVAH